MPIPSPHKSQKKSDFIRECSSDPVMNKEYPDAKQKLAICFQKWEDRKKQASACLDLNNDEVIYFTEEV